MKFMLEETRQDNFTKFYKTMIKQDKNPITNPIQPNILFRP